VVVQVYLKELCQIITTRGKDMEKQVKKSRKKKSQASYWDVNNSGRELYTDRFNLN
jgi:hypothetical protein